jgi:hypothetical protein
LNLRLIADAARDIGAEPILITQARLVAEANGAAERQTIPYDYVGLSHEGLLRAFGDCDQAAYRVAADKKVKLLDLRRLDGRGELFADHVHTSAAGSQAIASAVG